MFENNFIYYVEETTYKGKKTYRPTKLIKNGIAIPHNNLISTWQNNIGSKVLRKCEGEKDILMKISCEAFIGNPEITEFKIRMIPYNTKQNERVHVYNN